MTQVNRYSITLIVAAAIIIEVLGAAQYFMTRNGAKQEMLEKAQRDMQESQRVAIVKTEVETALKNAEQSIHLTLDNPETSYSIASRIIASLCTPLPSSEKATTSCAMPSRSESSSPLSPTVIAP